MMAKQTTAPQMASIAAEHGVYTDRLYKSKGHFVATHSYFYRMGRSDEKYTEKYSAIPGVKVLYVDDNWNAWPKLSFYAVHFTYEAPVEVAA